jgi:AraC-like DNA-binding protein
MLNIYIPKSYLLKKHIDFFYTFSEERPQDISYICFPHTNTSITFLENAKIIRSNHSSYFRPLDIKTTELNTYSIDIVGKFIEPLFVQYQGNVKEINIVFKPLGVNHFLKGNLSNIAPHFSQEFINQEWQAFMPFLFEEKSEVLQISLLENFLLTNMQVHDLTSMYKAIEYLEDVNNELNIAEIASLLKMNLKTFQRHFYKHLACTPSDYRRIVKFRQSLNSGFLQKTLKN